MTTNHGVQGWRDWRFWAVLSLYFLAGALFVRSGLHGRELHVVMPLFIAYLVMSALAWDYRLLGPPERPACLILHLGLGAALFLFINRVLHLFGDTVSLATAPLFKAVEDNSWLSLLVDNSFIDALRSIGSFVAGTASAVALFLVVSIFLLLRKVYALPLLTLLLSFLTLLTMKLGWEPFLCVLAGAIAVFAGISLQREDERQSAFWARVRDRLAGFGRKHPRVETQIKLDLLQRLFQREVLNEAEIRAVAARRLDCRPDLPALIPACRQVLEQLGAGDELIELRADARGQYIVLGNNDSDADPFTRWLALIPRSAVAVGFTLFYWLSPFDLIPDFIPVVGVLDDTVVGVVGMLAATQSFRRLRPTRRVDADGFLRQPQEG